MPLELSELTGDSLTLLPTLLNAYDIFFDDQALEKTGQLLEVAHDKLFYYDVPEYQGHDVSYRNTLPYEPWFSSIHGEKSGLRDAVEMPPGSLSSVSADE